MHRHDSRKSFPTGARWRWQLPSARSPRLVEIAIGAPVGPEDAGTGSAAPLALAPGMSVEAYLRTGERSPLGWLAKPLTDYFARALREE